MKKLAVLFLLIAFPCIVSFSQDQSLHIKLEMVGSQTTISDYGKFGFLVEHSSSYGDKEYVMLSRDFREKWRTRDEMKGLVFHQDTAQEYIYFAEHGTKSTNYRFSSNSKIPIYQVNKNTGEVKSTKIECPAKKNYVIGIYSNKKGLHMVSKDLAAKPELFYYYKFNEADLSVTSISFKLPEVTFTKDDKYLNEGAQWVFAGMRNDNLFFIYKRRVDADHKNVLFSFLEMTPAGEIVKENQIKVEPELPYLNTFSLPNYETPISSDYIGQTGIYGNSSEISYIWRIGAYSNNYLDLDKNLFYVFGFLEDEKANYKLKENYYGFSIKKYDLNTGKEILNSFMKIPEEVKQKIGDVHGVNFWKRGEGNFVVEATIEIDHDKYYDPVSSYMFAFEDSTGSFGSFKSNDAFHVFSSLLHPEGKKIKWKDKASDFSGKLSSASSEPRSFLEIPLSFESKLTYYELEDGTFLIAQPWYSSSERRLEVYIYKKR